MIQSLLALFIFVAPSPAPAMTPLPFSPWSVTPTSPVIAPKIERQMPRSSFWNHRFAFGYHFYQTVISPADGARCGMHPTCADYGFQAIQKHGVLLGGVMATERLMRDHGHDPTRYELIRRGGHTRLYDPVANNDFWFSENSP